MHTTLLEHYDLIKITILSKREMHTALLGHYNLRKYVEPTSDSLGQKCTLHYLSIMI